MVVRFDGARRVYTGQHYRYVEKVYRISSRLCPIEYV